MSVLFYPANLHKLFAFITSLVQGTTEPSFWQAHTVTIYTRVFTSLKLIQYLSGRRSNAI